MKKLHIEQLLPISLEQAWNFFSRPENLNEITSSNLTFKIMSKLPEIMYEGLMIEYRISPFFNIPFIWLTEITHIKDKEFFVDEQRIGPYKLWHHEHHFKQVENGVLMTDILHYDIGKWILGSIAGKLFVHKQVQEIFEYRYKKLNELFSKNK